MKILWLTLMFSCAAVSCRAVSDLDEKEVRISGTLLSKIFPGPPNYESIQKGDRPETAWIMTVASKSGTEDYQLVAVNDDPKTLATLKKCQGKLIHVQGVMWLGHTGHHHTKYVVTVESVSELKLP